MSISKLQATSNLTCMTQAATRHHAQRSEAYEELRDFCDHTARYCHKKIPKFQISFSLSLQALQLMSDRTTLKCSFSSRRLCAVKISHCVFNKNFRLLRSTLPRGSAPASAKFAGRALMIFHGSRGRASQRCIEIHRYLHTRITCSICAFARSMSAGLL